MRRLVILLCVSMAVLAAVGCNESETASSTTPEARGATASSMPTTADTTSDLDDEAVPWVPTEEQLAIEDPAAPAGAAKLRWAKVRPGEPNPNKERIEFHGGGSDPTYYSDLRYEGKYEIYRPTETSFSVEDRWFDGEEWYHVTFRSTFDAPPDVLIPGESYPLGMEFSHTGSVTRGNPGAGFRYVSPNTAIGSEIPLPDSTLWYYPWAEVPSEISAMTWILHAPPVSQAGLTLEVYAQWWNAPSCVVKWTYRAE